MILHLENMIRFYLTHPMKQLVCSVCMCYVLRVVRRLDTGPSQGDRAITGQVTSPTESGPAPWRDLTFLPSFHTIGRVTSSMSPQAGPFGHPGPWPPPGKGRFSGRTYLLHHQPCQLDGVRDTAHGRHGARRQVFSTHDTGVHFHVPIHVQDGSTA